MGGGGTDDHRCVGNASGHDDVGSGIEAPRDAPRTKICVRGERARVGGETELVDASEEIVTFDVGDARRQTEPICNRAQRRGQTRRVETSRVRDDPHALVEGEPHAVLGLPQEGLGVTEIRILQTVTTEDEHRQFREVVAGQVVEFPAFEHLAHRRQTVAVEAGAVADSHDAVHAIRSRTGQPVRRASSRQRASRA